METLAESGSCLRNFYHFGTKMSSDLNMVLFSTLRPSRLEYSGPFKNTGTNFVSVKYRMAFQTWFLFSTLLPPDLVFL